MGKKFNEVTAQPSTPNDADLVLWGNATTGLAYRMTFTQLKAKLDGMGVGDVTAPTVVSATVPNGAANTVVVVFSESVTVTTAGWSFRRNASNWVVSSVAGSGTTWTFTMATSAVAGETIDRSYNSATGATVDGASNELVSFTNSSVTNSVSGAYEAESDAYFAVNTGLTVGEKNAVDAFIVGLKALGISKFPAVYLPVWGSAADNKWNVLNPADTDGAGRLTFHGTLTHAADGLLGDGTTGYADTKLLASSIFTKGGAGAGVYMKTANTAAGGEIGVVTGSDRFQLFTHYTGTTAYARSWNVADGNVTGTPTNGTGFFQLTRNSLTDLRLMENTTQLDTTNTFDVTPQTVPATNSIYLMALNVDGSASLFSNGKMQLAVLHTGLSFTDAQDLSNLVNDLITDLGI